MTLGSFAFPDAPNNTDELDLLFPGNTALVYFELKTESLRPKSEGFPF